MDKKKFGQISPCLPYLPFQKVWTFWKNIACHFYIFSKVLIHFFKKNCHSIEGRLLGVKLPHFFLQRTLFAIILQDFFSRSPYQYQKYKYGHPYLTYLPQFFLSKLFFQKKFGSKVPYLPTVWTYVQNFVVFLFGTLSLVFLRAGI